MFEEAQVVAWVQRQDDQRLEEGVMDDLNLSF